LSLEIYKVAEAEPIISIEGNMCDVVARIGCGCRPGLDRRRLEPLKQPETPRCRSNTTPITVIISKKHPDVVVQFVKDNPGTPKPQAHPGMFPSAVTHKGPGGKDVTEIIPVKAGSDIQSMFFDMWRQDHPDAPLANVPGDYVTTSGSGLDPDITLENAEFQLDRVAGKWAQDLHRDPAQVKTEIQALLQSHAFSPGGGLFGERLVNVLEVNLALRHRYSTPA
jgi:potassium-transporting ATPase KdpC subunit